MANKITQAVGVPGLSMWRGYIYEEYLNELKDINSRSKIFREMLDDAVVGTLMDSLWMPLLASEFTTKPGGDESIDEEAAEFLDQCMNDMTRYSWRQHVLDMLSITAWGWSVSEIVMKKRMGPNGEVPSKYDDGLIGLKILDPRGQETLYQWNFEEDPNSPNRWDVNAMVQQDPTTGQLNTIETWKMLHATWRSRKRNPEGQSPLRSLYRAWYTRKSLEIIECIGAERDLAGLPVMYLPAGADDKDKATAEELVRKVRIDEEAGLVIPRPPAGVEKDQGWKFELLGSAGTKQYNVREVIRDLNKIILMRFFAQFLLLGMDKVGTQALVEGSQDFFSLALKSIQQELLECWNDQLVPMLFKMNSGKFGALKEYPKIEWDPAGSKDLAGMSLMTKTLVDAGILTPDDDLEDYFRVAAGFPEKMELPPEAPPTEMPPGWPPGIQGPDGVQPGAPPPEPVSVVPPEGEELLSYNHTYLGDGSWLIRPKARAARNRRRYTQVNFVGARTCMVSLPVDKATAEKLAVPGGERPGDMHVTLTFHGDVNSAEYEKIAKIAADVCVEHGPFNVRVDEPGVFENKGERAFHVKVVSDELMDFRRTLAAAFDAAGVSYSKDFDYSPHITLKYLAPDESLPEVKTGEVFSASGVRVHVGDKSMSLSFAKSFAQVEGTTGRKQRGGMEKLTNDFQARLVKAYDKWLPRAAKVIVGAEKGGQSQDEIVVVVDQQLQALSVNLKEVCRDGIREAVMAGMKGVAPDAKALRTIAAEVESADQYVDGLLPRLKESLLKYIEQSRHTYQLEEFGLLGLLQSLRGQPAGLAGAFWRGLFVGAGILQKQDKEERLGNGEKPRRVKWVLDPSAKHCQNSAGFYGCEDLAGEYESWDDMPTVPAGQTSCRGNCRCHIEVEGDGGGFERVV